MASKRHAHILLSENQAGSVGFCETCNVIELEFGAISLRIDEPSLSGLCKLLQDAEHRLNIYKNEKKRFIAHTPEDLLFH